MFYLGGFYNVIKRPIFVIGMPRSGTTVISQAMSVHEDLGWFSNYFEWVPFIPEISLLTRLTSFPKIGPYLMGKKKQDSRLSGFIRRFLPHCSEAYPVWRRYCSDRFEWDYLLNQVASENEKCKIKSIISKVLLFQGKSRFFAKYTGPPRINYVNSIFPDAFFVHVIRDPRATVSSLVRVPFWKKGGGFKKPWWQNGLSQDSIEEWVNSGRSPVALAAIQWKEVLEVAWQGKKTIGDSRYIELHYKNFVSDPNRTLKDIFAKVDLPDSKRVWRFISSIGMVQDMNYKFRLNLTPNDIRLIEKITLHTAQKAGYVF